MQTLHLIHSQLFTDFPQNTVKEVKTACGLRRADRFTVIAATALKMAFPQQFPVFLPNDTALLTASSFGPHKTVFETLDDILDFPEDQILPTKFSHSVHNAVTSYLGTILKINGPAFAVTNFESPLFETLSLASTLLATETASSVLVVMLEERGLLTEAVPKLIPEQFPQEPAEAAAVFLASKQELPTSAAVELDDSCTQPRVHGAPFALDNERLSAIANHRPFTLFPFMKTTLPPSL